MANTLSETPNKCQHEMPRDFKGIWIPKELWLDHRLSFFEKCLAAEIDSLDGRQGCYASNQYFEKFFNANQRTVQRGIARLKELGYIRMEMFNGRERVLRSCIKNHHDNFDRSDVTGVTKMSGGGDKNVMAEVTKMSGSTLGDLRVRENKEENKVYNNNIIGPNSVHKLPPPSEAPRSADAPLSADASDLLDYFIKKIKEKKPTFKEPNRKKWGQEIERMLRIDKRDPVKTKLLIDFIVEGKSFPYIQSADKLREKYDQQEAFFDQEQQNQKLEPNKKLFYTTKAKYPERFKNIRVTKHGILNEFTGKDADWSLPEKTFGQILAVMIGGSFNN